MSHPRSRWAYLATLTPIIFATTYLLTTQFLPPGRPMLASMMRSLPTGLVLVLATRTWPPRGWWGRFLLLSVLYCSAFFPLLFIAAYLLPGGVAAVINSVTPLIVVVLSVPLLHKGIRTIDIVAGGLGILGVSLLVLRSSARLDGWGILAMTVGFATVLTKRGGPPPGWGAAGFTGWTFLLGGLALLPFTLAIEGLPTSLTPANIGGLIYLVLISGIFAYGLWFWGLQRLPATAVSFLALLNPVIAAGLGWVVLDQALNGWQLVGAAIVLLSVLLGQNLKLRRATPVASKS